MPYHAPMGSDSLMLSLGALFDRAAAADLETTIAIHLGDEPFQIRIAHGELTISRGDTHNPDATLHTDQRTLLLLLRTDTGLDELETKGTLRITGNAEIVERFRRLFPLPQPVPSG
jgi:alkyl sulfatase BDS1-like metallo-beta-lactamase superfamily hydrolase